MTTRVCPNCGQEFEPSRANQRYCSIPCRERGYYKRYKKYHDRLNAKRKDALHASWGWNTCAECGRVYAVTAANLKIVCSEECRKKRIARQIKEAHRRQTAKAWELAHPNEGTYEEHLKAKAAEKAANKAIKDIEKAATEANRSAAQSKKARKAAQKRFEGKLKLYAAQGITYGEAQARDTIERFARIDLGGEKLWGEGNLSTTFQSLATNLQPKGGQYATNRRRRTNR